MRVLDGVGRVADDKGTGWRGLLHGRQMQPAARDQCSPMQCIMQCVQPTPFTGVGGGNSGQSPTPPAEASRTRYSLMSAWENSGRYHVASFQGLPLASSLCEMKCFSPPDIVPGLRQHLSLYLARAAAGGEEANADDDKKVQGAAKLRSRRAILSCECEQAGCDWSGAPTRHAW